MVVRLPGQPRHRGRGRGGRRSSRTPPPTSSSSDATVTTTGAPVLLRDINDYLTGGMLVLGAIAVGLMVIILLVLFDVRWRLLPLGVILVGVVWAFGLAGYLGIPLTVVTIAGLPVMLGVGIDYAIQMHARVEEEVVIDRAEHPIQETAANLGPALLVVTFDAIFAFAALRFAKVPMIRDFGLLLAVGIAVICLCSIIGPLAALGIREYKSPTTGQDFREGTLGRLVVMLGRPPHQDRPVPHRRQPRGVRRRHHRGGRPRAPDRPGRVGQPGLPGDRGPRHARGGDGSSSELGMFVQSDDIFDDETVALRRRLRQRAARPSTPTSCSPRRASSPPSASSWRSRAPAIVPPTGEEVEAAFDVAPADIQMSTANVDAGALNLIFRTGAGDLEERAVVVRRDPRHRRPPPEGVTATPVGPRRGRRRPPRQPRGEPDPAHLPRDPLRVPLPRGAAAQRRAVAAVAGAGADRGRRRVARGLRAST